MSRSKPNYPEQPPTPLNRKDPNYQPRAANFVQRGEEPKRSPRLADRITFWAKQGIQQEQFGAKIQAGFEQLELLERHVVGRKGLALLDNDLNILREALGVHVAVEESKAFVGSIGRRDIHQEVADMMNMSRDEAKQQAYLFLYNGQNILSEAAKAFIVGNIRYYQLDGKHNRSHLRQYL